MRHTTLGRARSTLLGAATVLAVVLSPMAAVADDTEPLGDSPFVSLSTAQSTGTAPFNNSDDAGSTLR